MEGDRGEGTIAEPVGDEHHVAIKPHLCAREGDAQPLPLLGGDGQRMGGAFDPDGTAQIEEEIDLLVRSNVTIG